MKIVFTSVRRDEKSYFLENLKQFHILEFQQTINKIDPEKVKDADILSVFIFDRLDRETLSKFDNLKLIITRSTGVDHIDLEYCRQKGIKVAHIPGYSPESIAEHTFGLILCLTRKLKKIEKRAERLDYSIQPEIMGKDLYTLSLGIIGTGRIGTAVARIASAFRMKIFAYDIRENPEVIDLGGEYLPLEELLKKSDIITLHTPLTDKTYHLIDRKAISLMKDGVILINTSRGGVVDTDAVYEALQSGKIAGLGLDVFEDEKILMLNQYEEGKSSDKVMKILKLNSQDNVVVTPHVAFFTEKATENIKHMTVECIKKFIQGEDISDCLVVA
ncbi:NAD(P)-dependent oxidoreductase [Persephonella sp.]